SNEWFAQTPITYAAKLRDVSVALYTGNTGDLELLLRDSNYYLRDTLMSLKIPVYFNDYGNGQSIGYDCDGGHTWSCWNAALIDVLPRMMAVLQQKLL
ncbi:unnamed protein product, partial [Adineta steineri]